MKQLLAISIFIFTVWISGSTYAMDMADLKNVMKKINLKTAENIYFVRIGDGEKSSQTISNSAPRVVKFTKRSMIIQKPSTKYELTVSADDIVSVSHQHEPGKPVRILIR